MKIEQKINQYEELIDELVQLHEETSRRLRIMENIQAIVIPVYIVLGLCGLAALLKVLLHSLQPHC